ncbi:MAG: hypothetical protein NC411_10885 [Bacteroides sp.]|nr:hypothetical protein [Bacteroides sp.]
MIAVIADDITGAAEMAGIAHRLGLAVKLVMEPEEPEGCDVMVVATDTRSMTEREAVDESRRVARAINAMKSVESVFKKTDSAIRGHVVAELRAILDETSYTDALYIPANPSKGRTIREGSYYINGKPLHETDFSFDPEFPAFSSSLSERFPDAQSASVRFADAESQAAINSAVESSGTETLLAGAADLFTAFLKLKTGAVEPETERFVLDVSDLLILCGSTQSKSIACGAQTCYMPTELYDGIVKPDGWISELTELYSTNRAMILAMRDRHRTGHEAAVYLRETMAEVVSGLVASHPPRELVIEGGATAYAVLRRLGWETFDITNEIAPGVIRMHSPTGVNITMKPGSYPWGGLF